MSTFSRRAVVAAGAGLLATAAGPDRAQSLLTEEQSGDPALPAETLSFDPQDVDRLVSGQHKAAFEPRIANFGQALLAEASKYVGENRQNATAQVTEFLALFDLPFAMNGKVVPFCAAGLSWVSATLYARQAKMPLMNGALRNYLPDLDHYHLYPTPSVLSLKEVALGKQRWVARGEKTPKTGWLVVYNWNGGPKPSHVGIVDHLDGSSLHTIEFNTSSANDSNGGQIARRVRPFNHQVEGFVRTDLAGI